MEQRTYTIPHHIYEDGKYVKTVNVEFKTNITDTHVYIRMDVLSACHSQLPHGKHTGSAVFNKENFGGRKIVFENEKFGYVGDNCPEIAGYKYDCNGRTAQYVFDCIDRGDITIVDVVWDHPFIKK